MHFQEILVASSALFAVVAAVPFAKREVIWVTDVVEDVVTIPVIQTVWVKPGQKTLPATSTSTPVSTTSSVRSHYGHHSHFHPSPSPPAANTLNVPSAPVAPAAASSTSSTSVYIAPSSAAAPSSSPAPPPASSSAAPTPAPTPSSTTSVYVAPAPTTSSSIYVAPSPSPSAVASSAESGSGSTLSGLTSGLAAVGKSYTGDLTWYETGMGSCGWTNTASEHIVAVSHVIFDSYSALAGGNPNNNPICGKYVTITGKDGSSYQAKVVDRCVGCAAGDLDLSEDFFNTVTDNGNGRVPDMSWSFV